MSRLVLCAILAAAIVIALHSGSVMLALAAICGACGVISLAGVPAKAPGHTSRPLGTQKPSLGLLRHLRLFG
jgi:hypothetical protein